MDVVTTFPQPLRAAPSIRLRAEENGVSWSDVEDIVATSEEVWRVHDCRRFRRDDIVVSTNLRVTVVLSVSRGPQLRLLDPRVPVAPRVYLNALDRFGAADADHTNVRADLYATYASPRSVLALTHGFEVRLGEIAAMIVNTRNEVTAVVSLREAMSLLNPMPLWSGWTITATTRQSAIANRFTLTAIEVAVESPDSTTEVRPGVSHFQRGSLVLTVNERERVVINCRRDTASRASKHPTNRAATAA